MVKVIQIRIPNGLDAEDVISLEKEIKDRLERYIILAKLYELVDELNLTEEDLKKFKETRRRVWSKYKAEYMKKGVL